MGSPHQTITLQCTRLLSPLLSWLSPSPTRFRWLTPQPRLTPQPLPTSLLPTRRRSFPLSLSPMSMELLMTTARPTSRTESQDAEGKVIGSFVIALPDGRIQTTTYTADHYNGFVADVTYEGTPVYPPEPKEGYGHAAPAYKPAPAYAP